MYVNQGTDQWEIPNYYGFGASSKKSGYFRRAVKQADIFTSTDFGYLGTQWNLVLYDARWHNGNWLEYNQWSMVLL